MKSREAGYNARPLESGYCLAISPGTRLGPYEIVGSLGAGGMGEVYRARDTRLDRVVAIKVLSTQVASTPDLRQRFEREARAISALNHPHICALYDIGSEAPVGAAGEAAAPPAIDFLVMEYIEGETLATRLQKGALPTEQIVSIGTQIAEALEKAHRAGIVHRDLKPGNVMLTRSGAKLLDFGLAKPLSAQAAASGSAPLLSAAVTMPSAAVSPLTSQGMIVGTIQYMSPEQIEGKEADARSDIFALGAVLYEMATGKRAFEGKSQISVASAILEKDPEPMSGAQPTAPAALDYCIRACLAKNPDDRLQTAHDVALQLKWVAQSSASSAAALAGPRRRAKTSRVQLAAATLAAVVVTATAAWLLLGSRSEPVIRAEIGIPEKLVLDPTGDNGGPPALSPDGTKVVLLAHGPDSARALWVRPIDSFSAQRLEGTENGAFPFWSPDSRSIGFFTKGKLNKVLAAGGPVVALADAPNARGGSWNADNVIVFAPDFQGPLFRVSASGGRAVPATKIDAAKHTTHRWPWFLPDGKHFLYLATNHNGGDAAANGIYWSSLDGGETRLVQASESAAQFASGRMLFYAQGALMAQTLDPGSGKLSGEPVALVDRVRHDGGVWRSIFSVSNNGDLLYQPGTTDAAGTQLIWFARDGTHKLLAERGYYSDARISPDGKKVVATSGDPAREVWVIDAERGTKTRLTFDAADSKNYASWSPDGKMVVFSSASASGGGAFSTLRMKAGNGSGSETVVAHESGSSFLYPQWTPDGKSLAYIYRAGPTGGAVYVTPLGGEGKRVLVVAPAAPQADIADFRISPDGRWIAYSSNESGVLQVYITSFPTATGKWQVTSTSSDFPAWRADGKELYFIGNIDDTVYACDFAVSNGEVQIGTPKAMLHADVAATGMSYDAAPDGKRFLFNVAQQDAAAPMNLVVNWTSEMRKK